MGLFEHFPYTNFHELNADWLLRKTKELLRRMDDAEARLDAAEARLDAAEGRLDVLEADVAAIKAEIVVINQQLTSLDSRMTQAETDIEALEERMTQAEADISALEIRMTQAEADIDALEARASAIENKMPVYILYDDVNIPDPFDYADAATSGRPIYLKWVSGNNTTYLPLYYVTSSSTRCYLYFLDVEGQLTARINSTTARAFCQVSLRNSTALGEPTWQAGAFTIT